MTDRIIGPTGSKRRKRFLIVPILLIAAAALLLVGAAQAVHDEAFQLDGDVSASTTTSYGGNTQTVDWDSIFNASGGTKNPLPAGFTAAAFKRDFNLKANGSFDNNDATTYTQGSKDIDNVSAWVCTSAQNVTDKGDIMNAYAVAYTDPVSGDQKLYFALERSSNNGDANVGFWFLQDGTVDCDATNGTTNFTGNHQDGDIFIVSAFTKGGDVSTITAFRWNGGANGSLGSTPAGTGGDCRDPNQGLGDKICAAANTGTISTPWLTDNNGKNTGLDNSLNHGEFFEGGINLTTTNLAGKCFNTFVGDTRSSQSTTATLYDFARGTLGECHSHTVTTPTPAAGSSGQIPANAQVTSSDSAHVTVDGVPKFSGTVKFYICGPNVGATANCQTGGDLVSTTTLTDATSPQDVTSSSVTLTEVGKYCWRAEYSGDTTRGVPGSKDPSNATDQSECFTITPRPTTLTTCAGTYDNLGVCTPTGTVDFGNPVTDLANLTNTANRHGTGGIGSDGSINPTTPGGPAQGTITFTLYKADCTTLATGTGTNPQTVNVSGDNTYGPVSFTPNAPGTYHWVASYSGDPPNTSGTSHNTQCTDSNEDVIVRQIPTEIRTKQSWIPNDTAEIKATSGNLAAGGTVAFSLYDNAACSGNAVFSETKTLTGGNPTETVSTNNTSFNIATLYDDPAGTMVGYSWKVVYTPAAGDTVHTGKQSACNAEHFTITYTNDPGPGTNLP